LNIKHFIGSRVNLTTSRRKVKSVFLIKSIFLGYGATKHSGVIWAVRLLVLNYIALLVQLYFVDQSVVLNSRSTHWLCSLVRLVQCQSKNFITLRFSGNFSQQLRIFKQTFTHLFYFHIYAKLHNFIQLSLNFTELPHVMCNHPVNFHFLQRI